MKRSQQKYVLGAPLRDISHRQLQCLGRIEPAKSVIELDLNFYIEENKQLKIKCAKIDQIENCANILMENVQKYKKKNRELQKKVMDLTQDNDKLRVQAQKATNVKYLKEENLRKQGEISGLRKKIQINDNFHLIRLEQQLTNQKQARERMVSNIEGKHKADLSKMQHQHKLTLDQFQHDIQMLKERIQSLVKQNATLKMNIGQMDSEVRTMVMENQHLQAQLLRAQDLLLQAQSQINLLNENYTQIKVRSEQALNTLTMQVHRLNIELDKSAGMQAMLQKINAQLKNEGGVLILQNEEMKIRTLQLQELHLIDLTNIKNLQAQLNAMMDSIQNIQGKMVEKDMANRQTMDTVQRDNIVHRKTIKDLQLEMGTKQKEIQDLIMIVAQLETEVKVITSNNAAVEQTNASMACQIKEKQIILDSLTQEASFYKHTIHQLETTISQGKTYIQQLQKEKAKVEQLLIRERQSVQEMQRILQIEKKHLGEDKSTIKQLQREIQQKQSFLNNLRQGKEQYEKMFSQQREQNLLYKKQVQELQSLVIMGEQVKKKLMEEFELQKSKITQEGMQQMQQLISHKYDQILKQYQGHYDDRISSLQDQIRELTSQLNASG